MLYMENFMETDEPAAKRFRYDDNASRLDSNMCFMTSTGESDGSCGEKEKRMRDLTIHRINEKRRRDRMNTCLTDLGKLMPSHYLKKGQGRIEKTEIIELAIKLIKDLHKDADEKKSGKGQDPMCLTPLGENAKPCCTSKFYMGFKECQDEVMRFLVETEDNNMSDQVCISMMQYLGNAAKKFLPTMSNNKGDSNYPSAYPPRERSRESWSSSSSSSTDGKMNNKTAQNEDVTSDSGFTNTDSAFSSKSLPMRKRGTEMTHYSTGSPTSSCSGQGTYKLKRIITQRFSRQEQKVQQSDTSSSSSREEHNQETARERILKKMTSSYNNESTPYPSSSDDSFNQSSVDCSNKSSGELASTDFSSNISFYLPGFVLHPSGSHYFPVSIHPANVPKSLFSSSDSSNIAFHPVSIPVRFSGPCIPIEALNVNN